MKCMRIADRWVQGLDAATSNRIMEAAKAQQEEMEAEDAAAHSLPGLAQVVISVLPLLFSWLSSVVACCMVGFSEPRFTRMGS